MDRVTQADDECENLRKEFDETLRMRDSETTGRESQIPVNEMECSFS